MTSRPDPSEARQSAASGSTAGHPRIAAVGDLHFDGSLQKIEELQMLLNEAAYTADVLLLCGDLTSHGQPGEIAAFVRELQSLKQQLCVWSMHTRARTLEAVPSENSIRRSEQ